MTIISSVTTHNFNLPLDVHAVVFSRLSLKDLARSSRVCKLWHKKIQNEKTLNGWLKRQFSGSSLNHLLSLPHQNLSELHKSLQQVREENIRLLDFNDQSKEEIKVTEKVACVAYKHPFLCIGNQNSKLQIYHCQTKKFEWSCILNGTPILFLKITKHDLVCIQKPENYIKIFLQTKKPEIKTLSKQYDLKQIVKLKDPLIYALIDKKVSCHDHSTQVTKELEGLFLQNHSIQGHIEHIQIKKKFLFATFFIQRNRYLGQWDLTSSTCLHLYRWPSYNPNTQQPFPQSYSSRHLPYFFVSGSFLMMYTKLNHESTRLATMLESESSNPYDNSSCLFYDIYNYRCLYIGAFQLPLLFKNNRLFIEGPKQSLQIIVFNKKKEEKGVDLVDQIKKLSISSVEQ